MTWFDRWYRQMTEVYSEEKAAGKSPTEIAKAIDDSYTWPRERWPYKAWLKARRQFFDHHSLPRPRARKPKPDLLSQ